VLFKDLQDEVDIHSVPFVVFFLHFSRSASSVNGNVVHVDREPSLGDLFSEDSVHHHLEYCGRVGEAKEHYHWFEEPFWGKEGGLPLVPWFDPDIIVPPVDIEFCEEGTATEAVDGLWDERGDVPVLLRPFIHRSVVLDWAQLPIFLFDKEEIGSIGAPRFANRPPL
jgi:hypothetical protein